MWLGPGGRSVGFDASVCAENRGLALGGGQVAWITAGGGNSLEMQVVAARLSGGPAKAVDSATNGDGAGGDPSGAWVGQLLGGGPLLAYRSWTVDCNPPPDYSCGENDPTLTIAGSAPVRIAAGRRVGITAGGGARVATVAAVAGNPPRSVALGATRLAVLRTATLDVYDASRGTKSKSVPLGPSAALDLGGVTAKLALLHGSGQLVLVRLGDGRLIAFLLTPAAAKGLVDARLTDAGLFYAYNTTGKSPAGRIVFEPTAALLARF